MSSRRRNAKQQSSAVAGPRTIVREHGTSATATVTTRQVPGNYTGVYMLFAVKLRRVVRLLSTNMQEEGCGVGDCTDPAWERVGVAK
jgi:hypothetical protein